MQTILKTVSEIGAVAAPASVSGGMWPSMGEYPLLIFAEHAVTPDFIIRVVALIATIVIVGFTIQKHLSED